MSVTVLLLAGAALTQTYACEAGASDAIFTDRNRAIIRTAPSNPPAQSSFKISVTDKTIAVTQIDGKSIPKDFKPFLKISGGSYNKYYSERVAFSLVGKAEPTIMTAVFGMDGTIVLIKSSPVAVQVNGGDNDSAGGYLPSIVTTPAFCSAEKTTK